MKKRIGFILVVTMAVIRVGFAAEQRVVHASGSFTFAGSVNGNPHDYADSAAKHNAKYLCFTANIRRISDSQYQYSSETRYECVFQYPNGGCEEYGDVTYSTIESSADFECLE